MEPKFIRMIPKEKTKLKIIDEYEYVCTKCGKIYSVGNKPTRKANATLFCWECLREMKDERNEESEKIRKNKKVDSILEKLKEDIYENLDKKENIDSSFNEGIQFCLDIIDASMLSEEQAIIRVQVPKTKIGQDVTVQLEDGSELKSKILSINDKRSTCIYFKNACKNRPCDNCTAYSYGVNKEKNKETRINR